MTRLYLLPLAGKGEIWGFSSVGSLKGHAVSLGPVKGFSSASYFSYGDTTYGICATIPHTGSSLRSYKSSWVVSLYCTPSTLGNGGGGGLEQPLDRLPYRKQNASLYTLRLSSVLFAKHTVHC
jgi:hypothetical protein